jgi:hypothetical protein
MKKKIVIVCYFIFLTNFLIAEEYMQSILADYKTATRGFNTREIKINDNSFINTSSGQTIYEYYIIDNDKYSNVLIHEHLESIDPGWGVRYEFFNYRRPNRQPYNMYYGDQSYLCVHLNGLAAPYTNPTIPTYSKNSIIKVYNISEDIIEQKYLTLFVKNMIRIINILHLESLEYDEYKLYILPRMNDFIYYLLPSLKKQELAIIRNLLFARHHYAFKTVFWRKFMNTYYPENYDNIYDEYLGEDKNGRNFMNNYYYKKYTGTYSEIEVMKRFNWFNWFEWWLLDLIIEYENKS